jgi:ArsR family transcriptional regulator
MLVDVSTAVNVMRRIRIMTTSLPLTPAAVDTDGCCTSVTGGILALEDAQRLARIFKALGDPTRVRLLSMIAAHSGGEACVCDLTEPVGLSQPTVSHHMKQLVDAGLVAREQRGRWAYYAIVPGALAMLSDALDPQMLRGATPASSC